MKITLLAVPGCPNASILAEHLATVLTERQDLRVVHWPVHTLQQAIDLGMNGSPTLLVDGVDPFAQPRTQPALSCRLYRVDGTVQGAPSEEQVRQALAQPQGSGRDSHRVSGLVHDVDSLLNQDAQRQEWSRTGERGKVHQAALQAFTAPGPSPTSEPLDETAAERKFTRVLAPLRLDQVAVVLWDGPPRWSPHEALPKVEPGGAGTDAGSNEVFRCDHIDVFSSADAARACAAAHGHVPSRILDPVQADYLGARLFYCLLPSRLDSSPVGD